MAATKTIAAKTLGEIHGEVAEASSLYGERLRARGDLNGRAGFSDLFDYECGGDIQGADSYRLGLEYIFEGYLLHYGRSRLLTGDATDFNLLAGDYMYARGLAIIASLNDIAGIEALAGLVQLCAYVHSESLDPSLTMNAWIITTMRLARRASGQDVHFDHLGEMVWGKGGGGGKLADLVEVLAFGGGARQEKKPAGFDRVIVDIEAYFKAEA